MFFYDGMKNNMTCALKLDTSRKGWYETMSKILGKRQGISYDWDAKKGKLYISGKIDAQKILKIVKLNKKIVEIQYMRTENQYLSGGVDRNFASAYQPPPIYPGGFHPPYASPPPPMLPYYNYHHDYNPYLPQLPYYY